MPRNVTASFRQAAESSFSDEVDLVFLTITHPTLSEPIRLNWDTKDFVYGGATFTGFPFDIELLSDDEGPPTARLQIQNIDPRIGDTIRMLTTPPQLKIELLSSADFDLTVDPRVESSELDSDTKLLLHCDGTDASTSFSDSSGLSHTVTAVGNAQVDTAQSQFGGASALFDGTGDALDCDGSADFAYGTGDFTIDFWFRLTGTGNQAFYDGRPSGEGNYLLILVFGGKLCIHNNSTIQITGTTSLAANTWYHCAVTRFSGQTRLFLNGTQEGSTYADSTNYSVGTNRPRIGMQYDAGIPLSGWMDELRILTGTAAWTSTFIPETAAYGTSVAATVIYSADRLFLTNVTVDVISISGQIVGWDYVQRVWPGKRATQVYFPGLFR